MVENFRAGSLDAKGLGYAQVHAGYPRVVCCSITGFGSGKGADAAGYEFLVEAVNGLMSITGDPDNAGGSPMKARVALVDVLAGRDAVARILAALHARNASALGQRVDVNLLSSLQAALVNQASAYLTTDQARDGSGTRTPPSPRTS